MTMGSRRHLAALAICLGVGAACERGEPAPLPFAVADSLVSAWVEAELIPGAVLRIEREGDLLFERAYGAAQAYRYGAGQYQDSRGLVRL
ncbi:MAG: hypothetical protein HKO77_01095, partial [Gemmatimonadetes bacterium]|nr:hypothetical protein [Gemmatimonadota bacterium]